MSIPVMRYRRNKILSDPASPVLNYLTRVPGHARTYTIDDVAAETEAIGAMSAEDVTHVMQAFVRSLRKILVRGDKVKIGGLGTFYTSFNCEGTEDEKDCTVRNIRKVNVRFAVDSTLRLVNESIATTRGAANNMEFYISSETKSETPETPKPGKPSGSGSGNDDDAFTDPDA